MSTDYSILFNYGPLQIKTLDATVVVLVLDTAFLLYEICYMQLQGTWLEILIIVADALGTVLLITGIIRKDARLLIPEIAAYGLSSLYYFYAFMKCVFQGVSPEQFGPVAKRKPVSNYLSPVRNGDRHGPSTLEYYLGYNMSPPVFLILVLLSALLCLLIHRCYKYLKSQEEPKTHTVTVNSFTPMISL